MPQCAANTHTHTTQRSNRQGGSSRGAIASDRNRFVTANMRFLRVRHKTHEATELVPSLCREMGYLYTLIQNLHNYRFQCNDVCVCEGKRKAGMNLNWPTVARATFVRIWRLSVCDLPPCFIIPRKTSPLLLAIAHFNKLIL